MAKLPYYALRLAQNRVGPGMHACDFYSSTDQLVAALVAYAVAGLRGNERCLWVTAPLLPAREEALRAACDDVDDAIHVQGCEVVRSWRS
jgi:hypothetical protein